MVENARLLADTPRPKRMCTERQKGGDQVKIKKKWEEEIKTPKVLGPLQSTADKVQKGTEKLSLILL